MCSCMLTGTHATTTLKIEQVFRIEMLMKLDHGQDVEMGACKELMLLVC